MRSKVLDGIPTLSTVAIDQRFEKFIADEGFTGPFAADLKKECQTWYEGECGDEALSKLSTLNFVIMRANTGPASPERMGTWKDAGWAYRCKWAAQVISYFKSKVAVNID